MVESVVNTEGTGTTYTDSGLQDDTLYAYSVRARTAAGLSERSNWDNANPGGSTVYLTFDDGPHTPHTGQILDLLESYGARATFFVVGKNAALHPDTIHRMAKERHGIGNHTWSHERLTLLTQEEFDSTVLRTQNQIGRHATSCLRPPFGNHTTETIDWARSLDLGIVTWTHSPNNDNLVTELTLSIENGAVVLLHDNAEAVEALKTLLERWSREGYQFKPVCEPPSIRVAPPNRRAEGAPTISGSPRVDDTLTADPSGITDGDGMTGASFSYQWLANNVEIAGATSTSYPVSAEDEGKTIMVRVGFTDDIGHSESRTSVPSASVVESDPPPGTGGPPQIQAIDSTDNEGELAVSWVAPESDEGSGPTGYQVEWKLSAGSWGSDSDISNAQTTNTAYVITGLSEGSLYAVRVRALYQGVQSATSEERLAGPMGTTPLTASFQNLPASHTGSGEFTLDLAFSEDISNGDMPLRKSHMPLRDRLLEVIGGMVLKVKRATQGNDLWRLDILPEGSGHVTIILPASHECSRWVGVCTSEGKRLSTRLEITVPGPATANSAATGTPTISGTVQAGQTLTVDTSGITDQDGLTNPAYSYQWVRNDGNSDSDIAGETASTYEVSDDDVGKTIKVRVTFTDDANNQETLTSAATDSVVARPNTPATGQPTISGTAQASQALTADTSGIDDQDGLTNPAYNYQWLADDAEIAGATASTYEVSDDDVGKAIKVRVTFTDDANNQETLTSAATDSVVARPNTPATGQPTISGTVQAGRTLTANTSGITDEDGLTSPTFTYQWVSNDGNADTDMQGATASTYEVSDDDVGNTIKVRVIFTDDAGNGESLTSTPTAAVTARPNTPATGLPTISGTAQADQTLTADTSGIDDLDGLTNVSYSHQWIRSGAGTDTYIAGETASTYTLADDDVGKTIKVRVSFTDNRDNEETLTSAATGPVEEAPQPLTASTHDVPQSHDGENVFTFELRFGEEPKSGFRYKTLRDHAFTVTGGEIKRARRLDQGSNIRWTVHVSPDSDTDVTIVLPITEDCDAEHAICTEDGRPLSNRLEITVSGPQNADQNNPATGAPTISGTAQAGQILTADTAGITDTDGLTSPTYSYQWVSNDGNADTDMQGATASTYEVSDDDVGNTIKVRVTFTDDAGNGESLTSTPTAAVTARPNTPATGLPTISGTAQAGQTLTADTSGIDDADGRSNTVFSYQWVSNDGNADTNIQDATASTYEVSDDDVGNTIMVRVTFSDDRGNTESLTSAATAVVALSAADNGPPEFATTSISHSVAENSESGTAVGDPVPATDPDTDPLTYTLSGPDMTRFTVDANGQLRVAEQTVLDYESQTTHTVEIVATDPSGESATITVTIMVTDVTDPNIVLIVADDVGHEAFGAYGSSQYSTPRVDGIADAGVRFTNAYSKPAATPSRVALMTGKSNVRNYVDVATLLPGEYTIADLFGEAGYSTAVAGKWQLQGDTGTVTGVAPGTGFDTYCLWHKTDTDEESSRYWDPSVDCDGEIVDTDANEYGPDLFVDFLLKFMVSNRETPFFVYYPMTLVHQPFESPPLTDCPNSDDEQCNFEDMVAYLDYSVGRIHDQLATLNLLDNTILVFTSDNGTHTRLVSELDGELIYGDKYRPSVAGTHVPLIVHVPGGVGGRVLDDLIDFTDFLPTLADAAGVEITHRDELDGVSFWDRLQGLQGQPREWLYTYYFPKPYRERFNTPETHPEIAYARDKRYQLYNTGELFDLIADPHELYPLPDDDATSSTARAKFQSALDSMPDRGEAILWSSVTGVTKEPRPRWRPVLSEAAVNGDELILTYAGTLKKETPPPADSFTVEVDGSERQVSEVAISSEAVTLTLSSPVIAGQSVTVSYELGTKPIRHANRYGPVGYKAAALTNEVVSNLTEDPGAAVDPPSLTIEEGGVGEYDIVLAAQPTADVTITITAGTGVTTTPASVSFTGTDWNTTQTVTILGARDGDAKDVTVLVTHSVAQGSASEYMGITIGAVTVTVEDDGIANVPATGAPTISGTAQAGKTLTADVSGIADDNGLTSPIYSYQWVSNDGNADTDIAGETASTYELSDDDVGKTIRVRATFTDDRDNEETLTSEATAVVAARPDSQDTDAPPRDPSETVDITVGNTVSGEIAEASEVDWFRVRLLASETYRIDMRGAWGGAWAEVDGEIVWVSAGTLEDPKLLGVFGEHDALVPGTDEEESGNDRGDSSEGKNSRIASFSPPADGYYYIAAAAEAAWTGTYEVTVTVVSDG